MTSESTSYPSGSAGLRFVQASFYLEHVLTVAQVLIDADDLPLNVSRETLQNNRFLRQIKNIVVTQFIKAMTKISEEDPERYTSILKNYNHVLKLGVIETAVEGKTGNRDKLAGLVR